MRHALRALRRAPGFTLVALVSLALGIGANLTVFAIVNALLLRPLPGASPDRLVSVYQQREESPWLSVSYPDYLDFRDNARTLAGLAAFSVPGLRVSLRVEDGGPEAAPATFVSANYFGVLELRPLRGRFFLPEEDAPAAGAGPLVISERLWRRRFDADPGVLGREVVVNRDAFRIVGVAPEGFDGTTAGLATDVWLPLASHGAVMGGQDSIGRRDSRFLYLVGRLAPGAARAAARAELETLARQLADAYPDTNRDVGVNVTEATGLPGFIRGAIRPFLALLMGVVGLVLLVACVNLAGLLLARGTSRARELAVRASLGASRARLVRQLLTEAVLLALAGGALGVLVARAATAGLLRTVPPLGLPVAFDLGMDGRVLAYALGIALATAVLFGLVPALRASRPDIARTLRDESAGAGTSRARLRAALLAGQVALTVVLLAASVLLVRGVRRGAGVDVGFDAEQIALATVDPAMLAYDDARALALARDIVERVRAVPGVPAAAARYALLGPRGDQVPVVVTGAAPDTLRIGYNTVGPGYFETLGIPLARGRGFTDRDGLAAPGVAVVGEAMARRLWPDADALGRSIEVRGEVFTVVGVARDAKYRSPGEGAVPYVFFPLAQEARLRVPRGPLVLHVRAAGDPRSLFAPVRRAVQALDPDLPVESERMTETIRFTLFPALLAGRIVGACGALALLLACVGLYGVAAYAVARRTREIGIRMALGARGADVVRLVLRDGLRIGAAGLALGLPAAFAVAHLLRGLLFGIPPADPITYAASALALAAAVALAGWGPARRATRVDPVEALRAE